MIGVVLLLAAEDVLACDCSHRNLTDKYMQSDFVATIKITRVYQNAGEEEIYKADIQITELFKGDSPTSVYVYGRSDGTLGSSCAIYIPENTELVAYARKDAQYAIRSGRRKSPLSKPV